MYEFERLASGNVLLKKDGVIIRVFPSETYMSIDPCKGNLIILNNSNGNANDADAYTVNADVVTAPIHSGRNDLMNQLALNYFKPVTSTGGGTASSVTIIDTIPAKTTTTTNIPNDTSEFLLSLSNVGRTECIVHNNSNTIVYVKYNSGVSSTNYTYKLFKQDTLIVDDFHGDLYAIAENSNGFIMITENFIV